MTAIDDAEPDLGLVEGALDVHVHTAPDLVDRFQSDVELARSVRDAGLSGAVVKSHVVPTAGRVELANEAVGDRVLYGGIALNGSVGGVNPDAAEVALELGAKVVWLPTAWSHNHARQARAAGVERFVGQRVPTAEEDLSVTRDGELTDEARTVVAAVAEHDAVLGTGHVAPEAIETVVDACADAGARCLVNHPFFRVLDLSIEQQASLADRGAVMEFCGYAVQSTDDHTVDRVAEAVARLGPERCLLATDFGQASNPPVEGLAKFASALVDAGVDRETVRQLVSETPADTLGV
ncbi:cytosolic protein [Halobellus sp. Atlit-31R]|nr:cytosolic protein [Halobellus sp. Atlit-31R]